MKSASVLEGNGVSYFSDDLNIKILPGEKEDSIIVQASKIGLDLKGTFPKDHDSLIYMTPLNT